MRDHTTSNNTELRQIIEQWEYHEAAKRDIAEAQREVMAEAKARGYDAKALREVIRLRKMKPDELAEFESIVDIYRAAAGF